MFIAERQMKIIEMIQKDGSVQVEKLAKDLGVSSMTIRRDLKRLKNEGIIERCHGGAVVKQEIAYAEKQISHKGSKELIASKCAEFVKENNVVFLDAGTTTYEIARLISTIPGILVVTNDLKIAQLINESEAELIICGGSVQKSTGSMYGYYATQMMDGFQFDIGFFGAASIDDNFQVLTPTIDKVFLKRMIMKNCKQTFIAVDDSKFNKKAMSKVADLADYTGVITDHQFTESELARLAKAGVKIIAV
ncbi:DeoR/GlpR family DNA-binding transcription regulator [Anaerobium acetethylicum]|uniref:DNA-binding transcriptional regulator of sugar metabolism, DeoR/GlpR family n=2 Tax=Anaerobium acetethylicum TaxID=1619234 RepID=A0A1D3TYA3_9FIRM|nr:DNA-binding transcriptional regulator of sugar metabolism, DeoR/GlpR family [Anaerobium acetethylicum]